MRTRLFGLLLVVLVGLLPASAQDENLGAGLIIQSDASITINPLICQDAACRPLTDLLFPSMYAVDPATRYPTTANDDNLALVTQAEDLGNNVQRLTLRDDLTWSDGTPITATDVLYSYLAIISDEVASPYTEQLGNHVINATVVDATTIDLTFAELDCSAPFITNFPVIPAHHYDPGFVDRSDGLETLGALLLAWQTGLQRDLFSNNADSLAYLAQVTAGDFQIEPMLPFGPLRLTNANQGYILGNPSAGLNHVDALLAGETNLLFNPPLRNRAQLLATDDLQIAQYPSLTVYQIVFNLADPLAPQDGLDPDGEIIEQAPHPVLGDVRVRQAIAMALDIDALIEQVWLGYATPVASQPPASWTYDPALRQVQHDRSAVETALTRIGWRDVDRDGARECTHCDDEQKSRELRFDLLYHESAALVAEEIREQLASVGIGVNLVSRSSGEAQTITQQQRFDAHLLAETFTYPVNADQSERFSRDEDRVGYGGNVGSYSNPEVERLLAQARTTCDLSERRALYATIQAILLADLPVIWLFAPDEMIVARGGVLGFDPLPHDPLWNITTWRVVP